MSAFVPVSPQAASQGNSQHILASVWQRNLPLMRSRVHTLLEAADQCQAGDLPSEARKEAAGIAHKLAGSLGMFGYPEGSEISKQLELLLEGEDPFPAATMQQLTERLQGILAI